MPPPKKNKAHVKPTDGRKHNEGTKKRNRKPAVQKLTPSTYNKAKLDRVPIFAINAIREVYGSEEAFMVHLAEDAKDNFQSKKLLMEYAYGKPDNVERGRGKAEKAPQITFIDNRKMVEDNTIDVEHSEDDKV